MRIIVWGINYDPELTGIAPYNTALCEHLAQRGHDVRMLTSFPYYPEWRKRPGDRGRLYRTETLHGVKVHRCYLHVPRVVTLLPRILHEASFVFFSLLRCLFLPAPDVFVIVSPPLLLGFAAIIASMLKRAPFVFHVQDLQPDAALGLGMLKMLRKNWQTRALYRLESMAYRHAVRVCGISRGMLAAFGQKGVSPEEVVLFPNGTVLPNPGDKPVPGLFRRRHGFSDDDFLAIYSGNLGIKQGLDLLFEAAPLLQNKSIRIILCGDGADRARLADIHRYKRLSNVLMLPLQEPAAFHEMLTDADLCLILQRAGTSRWFFPSKLLNIFAHAKPALTVSDADSELGRLIAGNKLGLNIKPGDPHSLAKAIDDLAADKERLADFGKVGRAYVAQYEMERVLSEFETVLADVASARRAG
jgi:colanic acid biosynthesis glycosyl transferase WcaI